MTDFQYSPKPIDFMHADIFFFELVAFHVLLHKWVVEEERDAVDLEITAWRGISTSLSVDV